MGNSIFSFIYNTMRNSANDPLGKCFLPDALKTLGLPLKWEEKNTFKLTEDKTQGDKSIQRIISNTWMQMVTGELKPPRTQLDNCMAIPDPGKPDPVVTLSDLVIHGLENIMLMPLEVIQSDKAGYEVKVTATGPAYEAQSRMYVMGKYSVEQSVWGVDKDDPSRKSDIRPELRLMKWPEQTVSWYGNFEIAFPKDVFANATLKIGVSNEKDCRTPYLQVTDVAFRGEKDKSIPEMFIDEKKISVHTEHPGIDDTLRKQAVKALKAKAIQNCIIDGINNAVNTTEMKQKMSGQLETYLLEMLDKQLGGLNGRALPKGGPEEENPVDTYLFDRARFSLDDKEGPFYLPKIIKNADNPRLDPYHHNKINLGDFDIVGLQIKNIYLEDLAIQGLSNTRVGPRNLLFEKDGILHAQLPLTIEGKSKLFFTIEGMTFNGGFEMTLLRSYVDAKAKFAGSNADDLIVTVQSLFIEREPEYLTIKVKLDTEFKKLIDLIFSSDKVKLLIVNELNKQAAGWRDDWSCAITQKLREIINEKLKG